MLSRIKGAAVHPPFQAGDCSLCHVPHASDADSLVTVKGSELCLACHGDVLKEGKKAQSTHPPVVKNCVACHDPHGSLIQAQLKQEKKELCLGCHSTLADVMDKPDTLIHSPAEGDCGLCHQPHESAQPKLLQDSQSDLCAMCHDTADPKVVQAHGEIQVKGTTCTGCHNPHASEGSGLFHPVVHKPFAGKVCTACHKK
jgi:predicted CXXCH cytochrome family protein